MIPKGTPAAAPGADSGIPVNEFPAMDAGLLIGSHIVVTNSFLLPMGLSLSKAFCECEFGSSTPRLKAVLWPSVRCFSPQSRKMSGKRHCEGPHVSNFVPQPPQKRVPDGFSIPQEGQEAEAAAASIRPPHS